MNFGETIFSLLAGELNFALSYHSVLFQHKKPIHFFHETISHTVLS